jgi:hypothetical protein
MTPTPAGAAMVQLNGLWQDDGLPEAADVVYPDWWTAGNYPEPPVWIWEVVGQPVGGRAAFENVFDPKSKVWLDMAGVWVLRGCVWDGKLIACDIVLITVTPGTVTSQRG